jgi:hypothetical protein
MRSSIGRWHRVRQIQEEGLGGGGSGGSRRSSAPSGRLGFVGWGVRRRGEPRTASRGPHPLSIALCDGAPPTMDWLGAPDQGARTSPLRPRDRTNTWLRIYGLARRLPSKLHLRRPLQLAVARWFWRGIQRGEGRAWCGRVRSVVPSAGDDDVLQRVAPTSVARWRTGQSRLLVWRRAAHQ